MATSKRVTTVSGGMVPDLWPTLALSIRHVHLVLNSAERQHSLGQFGLVLRVC